MGGVSSLLGGGGGGGGSSGLGSLMSMGMKLMSSRGTGGGGGAGGLGSLLGGLMQNSNSGGWKKQTPVLSSNEVSLGSTAHSQ